MTTIISLDGGLGRIITAIPALHEPRIEFTQEETESAYQDTIKNIEGDNKPKVIEKPKEIKGVSYN